MLTLRVSEKLSERVLRSRFSSKNRSCGPDVSNMNSEAWRAAVVGMGATLLPAASSIAKAVRDR